MNMGKIKSDVVLPVVFEGYKPQPDVRSFKDLKTHIGYGFFSVFTRIGSNIVICTKIVFI